ncbi:leucine-rich repeat domain-containing protein [Aureispira anguillae]|uniref:Leucine-rich repeat domain-containing protein n=1 Tax=Aureispira anguillae TaxID=2864201 RepID=A0A915YIC4_9BACT|nr:leucine-rich repeat domain-containing protein [Aureispira anguillae]BDS13628.1 leucine-rich repeat domain-containing protein [Aureispira anguillae]
MGLFSKIKKWFLSKDSTEHKSTTVIVDEVQEEEEVVLTDQDVVEEVSLTEEEQQFAQIKQFIESDDMSNHELAAMFMMGLGTKWDDEMYRIVAQSADKMIFWAQQDNNEHFLAYYKSLVISPRFFGQYSEIAEFAVVLTSFKALEELQWKAKHYWNQHPILVAASQLPLLKRLYVEDCRMNFLPESIAQAWSLEELYLANNKLTEMPDTLGQLPNLKILDLSANALRKCPRSIYHLKRLETLRLHNNPLNDIEPRMLGRLYRLKDLQLPEVVAKFNLDTLQDWLPDVDFGKPYWIFD